MRYFIRVTLFIIMLVTLSISAACQSDFCDYQGGSAFLVYNGVIGESTRIKMLLSINEKHITGSYYYERYKKSIDLDGKVDSEGNFSISEHTLDIHNNFEITGYFEGHFISEGQAEGEWINKDKTKRIPFQLQPIQDPTEFYTTLVDDTLHHEWDRLVRITADFNSDGYQDCALSYTGNWSAQNGGTFLIFFQNGVSDTYSKGNGFFFNPSTCSLHSIDNGKATLLIYWHISANSGIYGGETITKDFIKPENQTEVYFDGEQMKYKSNSGEQWYKRLTKLKRIPMKVEECKLEDYRKNNRCRWSKYNS